MSISTPDYNTLFDAHEKELFRRLGRLPKCRCCGEPVTDEYFYDLNGVYFCGDCLERCFRRCTHDYA